MMNKRKFSIDFYMFSEYVDSAVIELDNAVIDVVDDEWRSVLYDLHTPEEIAQHIAYNLFINNIGLSQMDGWANLSDDMVTILERPYLQDFDLRVDESY